MEPKNNDYAVALIFRKFDNRKEIYLQKKDLGYPWFPGKWCIPGGKIESGEIPIQTLEREIKREELGNVIDNVRYFMKHPYEDESEFGFRKGIQYVFICDFSGKLEELRIREGGGFGFFAEQELQSVPIIRHDYEVIQEGYKALRNGF
ncbi:NUDIX hydrolase [Candidatus Pacearchaeota archaeon]|nr:NUDIX hydrolase [Candidatus Pacearchaeota archaeon]